MKKLKKGFTIVELVIVIAVIAILAAVLIPVFSNVVEKANQSADQQTCAAYNKVVAIETVTNSDLTLQELIVAIEENGMNANNFATKSKSYNFAYDATNKKVVLIENGNIVYPKDAKTGGELWAVYPGRTLIKGVENYLLTKSVLLSANQAINLNGNDNVVFDLNNYAIQLPSNVGPETTIQNGILVGTTNAVKVNVKTEGNGVVIGNAADSKNLGAGNVEYVGKTYVNTSSTWKNYRFTANSETTKITFKNCVFSGYRLEIVSADCEIIIEDCEFYNVDAHFALVVSDRQSGTLESTSFKYTVRNNKFINCDRGINAFIPQGDSVIENNVFELTGNKIAVQIATTTDGIAATSQDFAKITIQNNTNKTDNVLRVHESLTSSNSSHGYSAEKENLFTDYLNAENVIITNNEFEIIPDDQDGYPTLNDALTRLVNILK